MSETTKQTCAQVISALFLSLDADRVAVLAVTGDAQYTILASRPTMEADALETAIVDDATSTRRTMQGVFEGSAVAVAPIVAGDSVPYAIFVQRDQPDDFGPAEVEVIEALARQLLPPQVTSAPRLRRDTIVDAFGLNDPTSVVWSDSEAEISEVGGELTSFEGVLVAYGEMEPRPPFSIDRMQDVLGQSVEDMIEMAEADVAAVLHVDGVEFAPVAVGVTPDAPSVATEELISRTIVEQVLWTGEPVVTVDARKGDLGMSAQSIQTLEITMVVCVPVVVDSTTVGALYIARFSLGANFNEEARDKLRAEAQKLAPALEALGPDDPN